MTRQSAITAINNTVSTPNLKTIALAALDAAIELSQKFGTPAPGYPNLDVLQAQIRTIVGAGDDITG